MSEPELPSAPRRVSPTPADATNVAGSFIRLNLNITDPEVIAELQTRQGRDRDDYALTALRVGVIALRQAGGLVDAEKLKSEGQRLIHEVEKRLTDHWTRLDKELQGELERYFDPNKGHLNERIKALVSEDGELSRLLRQHVDGDNSSLARQLADVVGKDSPLMKHLSPDQQDGLVQTITRVAQDRLEEQSKKVLGEFDLNNEQGALKRLVRQIETNFDPENEQSALGILSTALERTRDQIRKELTLDDEGSALSNLHAKLKKQISDLVDNQQKFQTEVASVLAEMRGRQQERAVSTRGGFDFEDAVGDLIEPRVTALGDLFDRCGDTVGNVPRSKVGDHVQTLGADSAASGAKIVYECKRDETYTVTKALSELEVARKNRGADIGVFVLAASSLQDNDRMQREFSRPLTRQGNDVLVIWDADDANSDAYLDAAVTLARALAIRERAEADVHADTDWDAIDRAFNGIDRQLQYFGELNTWCGNIKRDSIKIAERMEKMESDFKRELARITEQLDPLRP